MPLVITRRAGDEMDLGDPRSPTLRLRVVAIRPDAVDLSLHPLKPVQITLQEEIAASDPDHTPQQSGRPLSITRAEGQSITCGDPRHPLVVVAVASIKNDRARLSFDPQRFFDVHRREVADQVRGGELPPYRRTF
jgi:sRNA-binding carbon storage regulator CsrA